MSGGGLTARVEQDECPLNPRLEQDNASKMICFHRRYSLGDGHEYSSADHEGWGALEKAVRKRERPAALLPLYLMDHSGLTISVDCGLFRACDPHGWDWGRVGFALVRRDSPELGGLRGVKAKRRAEEIIRAEVEIYDQFLRGDVWAVVVKDAAGGVVDSLCGIYGFKEAEAEMKDMLATAVGASRAA